MKAENITTDSCSESNTNNCSGRREFLVKASAIAGGLALSLSGLKEVKAKSSGDDAANEAILKLDDKSPLNKVGGFATVETKAGKVVVVKTAEMTFKAYSAVCPHKGGPIEFDEKTQQLFCPWHNSRFDMQGQVVKGPARQGLQAYTTENAIVVELAAKS